MADKKEILKEVVERERKIREEIKKKAEELSKQEEIKKANQ